MPIAVDTQPLSIRVGGHETSASLEAGGVCLELAIPSLGTAHSETVGFFDNTAGVIPSTEGDFFLTRGNGWLAGCVARSTELPLEAPTLQLYRDLLDIVGDGQPIYRIWNYLPDINGKTGGLENYRWFNVGRHRAYYERFEKKMSAHISAASAVGMDGHKLALAFIAGDAPGRGVENPEQLPAYRYPSAYGPKSPSFTRGSSANVDGTDTAFLSGTSSIKGHQTVGHGNLTSQFNTTIENIRIVAEQMGCPTAVSFSSPLRRHFKFYLRHQSDFQQARDLFAQTVGEETAAGTVFLQADICRSDLALEIEGIFTDPSGG
jgi:chorismate lyase/3-hydroxybenzoate synthase